MTVLTLLAMPSQQPSAPRPNAAAAGIDVGGTFTDVVLIPAEGAPRAVKVPTTPKDQSEGLAGGLDLAAEVAQANPRAVAHGTTTATNAVLERRTARTVLVTTAGFRDVLTIGRQNRPSLYDLSVMRPAPLVSADLVVTVNERMAPDGSAVIPLTDQEVERVVVEVAALDPESVAVSLLFAYAGPGHEVRLCEALAQRLDVPITRSSQLLPEFREYERASTCVLDAAVAPVMRRYLERVQKRLPGKAVTVMTSAGGIADLEMVAAAPVHTLLSGPAAGVVAAAAIAEEAGFENAVAFDMGGTSTDVCLIRGGTPDVMTSGVIAGLPFATPSVAIHTVGAGGGSIAWMDSGGALQAGPHSAGADPGPACYGKGGTEPTVTDAHAMLGHLLADQPLGSSGLRLDCAAAEAALRTLRGFTDAQAAADGILTVVRAAMLRALRKVTTEQGVDPAGLALVAYGGAGPLHAAALARDLGCAAALVPAAPGVLSALGLLLAPPRAETSQTVMVTAKRDGAAPIADSIWIALAQRAAARIAGARLTRYADCRYAGQSHELRLEVGDPAELATAFDKAHAEAYGYAMPTEPVEVATLRVVAVGAPMLPDLPQAWDHGAPDAPTRTHVTVDGASSEVPVIARAALNPGERLQGPALIVQPDSTMLLAADEKATVTPVGTLVVRW